MKRILVIVIGCLVLLVGVSVWGLIRCHRGREAEGSRKWPGYVKCRSGKLVPISILAGPSHDDDNGFFILDETNSQLMTGTNDPVQERWCDIARNHYSPDFVSSFSYENTGPEGPEVRLRVDEVAATFRGRIEARRLKPNFLYQMKLRGVFDDRKSFEAIGFVGRWRLPGGGTNFTDDDYREFLEKEKVEAYVYFDYFFTDADGNASRYFELDASMHITWNASHQRQEAQVKHLVPLIVYANNPAFYAHTNDESTVELLWNERERIRYDSADQVIRLPPGTYHAELALTEESFHSGGGLGGFWATVYRCPVSFRVISQPTEPGDSISP
ncbi:MAG: hypothetical protein QGI24_00030 [Kiritimatiellia bacterium]|nr:hypothetical protein [Kiritimatiellia bacterium]MDP6847145.1 hypothetical protein [Kiritimatiellia bacterium]